MVVAALAAYKQDTLERYLPTVLHFRLQATLFLHKTIGLLRNLSHDRKTVSLYNLDRKNKSD